MSEDGINLSEGTGCNEQRATAPGRRIVRLLTFLFYESSGEKETSLFLVSLILFSVTRSNFLS